MPVCVLGKGGAQWEKYVFILKARGVAKLGLLNKIEYTGIWLA
jgi:hypothetical protein